MVIGALMGHVYRLQSRDVIATIEDVLRGTGEYVDKRFVTKKEYDALIELVKGIMGKTTEHFVRKEEFNILVKMVEAITEKLEGESFKPKIE